MGCGASKSSDTKSNVKEPVPVNEVDQVHVQVPTNQTPLTPQPPPPPQQRPSSALAKQGVWPCELFQFESIRLSKILHSKHYLIFAKQKEQLYTVGEVTVLIKLVYKKQQNPSTMSAVESSSSNFFETEYQSQVYPINLLVFPVKQKIIDYSLSKNMKFKQSECAYFTLNIKPGESYVIAPVTKQLNLKSLEFTLEVRPRDDVQLYELNYNPHTKAFDSDNGDIIRLHLPMCYGCKNFLFEDDNIVQQRSLLYHYGCAKYTCQLCNLDIENRNKAILCEGNVYHKECLDLILRCSECKKPTKHYYNLPNAPQLCESCFRSKLTSEKTDKVDAHLIKFWD